MLGVAGIAPIPTRLETDLIFLRRTFKALSGLCFVLVTTSAVLAQIAPEPFQPVVGQEGKDVVWVPTPLVLAGRVNANAMSGEMKGSPSSAWTAIRFQR